MHECSPLTDNTSLIVTSRSLTQEKSVCHLITILSFWPSVSVFFQFFSRRHHEIRTFSYAREHTCGSRQDIPASVSQKVIPSATMSLLGVPETPFPPVLTSHTTPLTGIRLNPCATPRWGGPPKFCIGVSSEHTPVNLPSRKSSFNLENDVTIAASEDFDLPQHSGASGSRHSVAGTVPTLLNSGSISTRKLVADYDSVASSSSSTSKLVADHETVASVEESVSRRKRDRDLNVVEMLKDKQNLHNFLERKAELALAVRGEDAAQKIFSETKAEMEIRNWKQRNADIALYETHPELGSQRVQLQQAGQWADQAQREDQFMWRI